MLFSTRVNAPAETPTAPQKQLALLFDLDGVLIHSMPLHTLAWEKYLEEMGVQVEDLERRMHGKRNPELVREFMGAHVSDVDAFEHGAAKERLWRKLVRSDMESYNVPGVIEFLKRYQNLPKAIGSNAEPANINFVLEEFGLRQFFPVVVDGFQVEHPKPFPDIYLKAAELLHVAPESCIVFEDSPTGIQAARAAGMRVVGVETTPTRFENVDLHIKDFTDPQLDAWMQAQQGS